MTSGSYQALQLQRIADSFRSAADIVTLPVPEPRADEISVRNHWCGVNGIFDTEFARGKAGYMASAYPSFTGVEASGVVEAIGSDVKDFSVGDIVASMRFRSGYREINVASASQFCKLPFLGSESLALASTGVAALLALEHAGNLKDGETVAVSAAAGGLGHLIVQLAKLRGCHVVAICGGAEKARFVAGLGADCIIDYRAQDVGAVLSSHYRDAIDVAVDTVGGAIFDALVSNLAPHGRLVVSGAAQDMEHAEPAPRIALKIYYKAARIQAFQNGLVQHLWPGARDRLFALHRAGALNVTCGGGFHGLASVYDAIEFLLSGRSVGKVAVNLNPENRGEQNAIAN
jgi:NADPH-dependent curcumin reductase CurA